MKNLNLSNEAVDFISTLDKKQAQPLWALIDQLLRDSRWEEFAHFGEGMFFTTMNEFIVIVKSDQETVYVNTIGRRYEAIVQMESITPKKAAEAAGGQTQVFKLDLNILELFVLSFALLFFALTVERWFLGDLNIFAAAAIFPLLACITGAAIGFFNKGDRLFKFMPVFLLLSVLVALGIKHVGVSPNGFITQALWHYADNPSALLGTIMVTWMAALLAGPFGFAACVASRIGDLFARRNPLSAYGTMLSALFFAYLAFKLSCLFCLAPSYQMALTAVALLVFASRELRPHLPLYLCLVLTVVAMFSPLPGDNSASYWGDYHKVSVTADPLVADAPVTITTDGTLQQTVFPSETQSQTSLANAGTQASLDLSSLRNFWHLAFAIKHPKTLLVLDSGIGAEVQQAFGQKIDSIDAVEIDPMLVELGKKFNRAYQSPTVHVHCQDPRSFVDNCQSKYDMVIFASKNIVAPIGVALGTQNDYEHTQEFYKKCLTLLNPGGILVFSFATPDYASSDRLRDRFYVTAKEASGAEPLLLKSENSGARFAPYLFVVAKGPSSVSANFDNVLKDYTLVKMPESLGAKAATDDCPYIYFKPGAFDVLYIACSLVFIATVSWLGQPYIFSKSYSYDNWQIFFLNTGLVCMVLGSIPRLVIMFGNGWLTMITIYGGILASGILAVAWLARYSLRRSGAAQYELILYVGLIASLILSYFWPVRWFSSFGLFGNLLSLLVTVVPLFRVLLMLPAIFSEAEEPAPLLGFTFLGFAAGLLLSHVALYLGQNSLLIVALVLFGFSVFLCITGQKALIPPVAKLATKRIT